MLLHFPYPQYLTYPISIYLVIFYCVCWLCCLTLFCLISALSLFPTLSAVCVTCLCGNPIWWWLRPCHWFRWHICHTHVCHQLLLLRLTGLQGKASFVDFLTGWLICLSGHRDPWPFYHLLPLTLPVNVTLDSLTDNPHPFPPPPTHSCMITRREMYGKINTCNSRSWLK